MPNPTALSVEEWTEIMSIPQVIELWELDETETIESFSGRVFGVKFDYPSSPDAPSWFYVLSDGDPHGNNMMILRNAQNQPFVV